MKHSLGFFLLFLGLTFLPVTSAFAGQITLRNEVVIDSPVIRLSDVFDGIETVRDKEIAIAPSPGNSVTYDLNVLTGLADRHHLAWKPQSLADRTILTRAASYITPDMIRDVILHKIKGTEREGETTEIKFDNRVHGLTLPADEVPTFDIAAFDYNRESRRFRGELVAQISGQAITQLVTGQVIIQRRIPVLAHRLPAGTVLSENDLQWIMMDDGRVGDDVLTVASQIVGQELRREQNEGDKFSSRDIEPPRLVRRGQIVTLKVETPFLQITTQGRVLQDGAEGESVRVTNTRSKQIVEGIVVGSGVIRVGMLRKIASVE